MRKKRPLSARKILLLILFSLGLVLAWASCATTRPADPRVLAEVQSIDQGELKNYSEELAAIGSRPEKNRPKTERTVRFIEDELKAAGYRAAPAGVNGTGRDSDGAKVDPGNCNVVAEIKGVRCPDRVIELGAHYDSIPFCPGADDNGSGVAGVLAVARALAEARCAKTIRFVFYGREETGGAGSLAHVKAMLDRQKEGKEQFEGVIVLESIGYAVDAPKSQKTPIRIPLVAWPPRTGNFITIVGNRKSLSIGKRYEQCAKSYTPDLKYYGFKRLGGYLKDAARSDHASYWDSGLPAIMLSDTANFRNPNYHQPTDRIDTLNFPFMTGVTQAAAAALLEWAETESGPEADTAEAQPGAAKDLPSKAHPAGGREVPAGDEGGNRLVFYREPCDRPIPMGALDDPAIGMSIGERTREEACREIVRRYWTAVIEEDEESMSRLYRPAPGGTPPVYTEANRPEKLVEVAPPYTNKGCRFGGPTFIVPARVELPGGKVVTRQLIVLFRDVALEESCVIIGWWGGW